MIDLTIFAEDLDSALADAAPCTLATNGPDGIPDIGFKGSIIVFDRDHLAYWERARGKHLDNVARGGGAAVMYFSREKRRLLRFFGPTSLYEDGPIRDEVMARAPKAELDKDPERKGAAVLIRVDRVADPFGGANQERDAAAIG